MGIGWKPDKNRKLCNWHFPTEKKKDIPGHAINCLKLCNSSTDHVLGLAVVSAKVKHFGSKLKMGYFWDQVLLEVSSGKKKSLRDASLGCELAGHRCGCMSAKQMGSYSDGCELSGIGQNSVLLPK